MKKYIQPITKSIAIILFLMSIGILIIRNLIPISSNFGLDMLYYCFIGLVIIYWLHEHFEHSKDIIKKPSNDLQGIENRLVIVERELSFIRTLIIAQFVAILAIFLKK
jgi:hypothetical protein